MAVFIPLWSILRLTRDVHALFRFYDFEQKSIPCHQRSFMLHSLLIHRNICWHSHRSHSPIDSRAPLVYIPRNSFIQSIPSDSSPAAAPLRPDSNAKSFRQQFWSFCFDVMLIVLNFISLFDDAQSGSLIPISRIYRQNNNRKVGRLGAAGAFSANKFEERIQFFSTIEHSTSMLSSCTRAGGSKTLRAECERSEARLLTGFIYALSIMLRIRFWWYRFRYLWLKRTFA